MPKTGRDVLRSAATVRPAEHRLLSGYDIEGLVQAASTSLLHQTPKSFRRLNLHPGGAAQEEEGMTAGSPEIVAKGLAGLRKVGVGHLIAWLSFGNLPHEKVRRSMELPVNDVGIKDG